MPNSPPPPLWLQAPDSFQNGIQANVTNGAMANALQSLDTVDSIEMINTDKRTTTLEDGKIIEKAMNLVAKKKFSGSM